MCHDGVGRQQQHRSCAGDPRSCHRRTVGRGSCRPSCLLRVWHHAASDDAAATYLPSRRRGSRGAHQPQSLSGRSHWQQRPVQPRATLPALLQMGCHAACGDHHLPPSAANTDQRLRMVLWHSVAMAARAAALGLLARCRCIRPGVQHASVLRARVLEAGWHASKRHCRRCCAPGERGAPASWKRATRSSARVAPDSVTWTDAGPRCSRRCCSCGAVSPLSLKLAKSPAGSRHSGARSCGDHHMC